MLSAGFWPPGKASLLSFFFYQARAVWEYFAVFVFVCCFSLSVMPTFFDVKSLFVFRAVERLFYLFLPQKGCFFVKNEEKMQILQKKSGKCFVVKKKAIPLHSLYNGNSATNNDRLFSSVGQST